MWLTADVHYTAAHYYDPNKAVFQDFEPFWEFVSGPIHAGTFGPNALDNTFGPQLIYIKAPTKEQGQNLAARFGLQFFGHVAIDGATEAYDGDAQGRGRSGIVGDYAGTEAGPGGACEPAAAVDRHSSTRMKSAAGSIAEMACCPRDIASAHPGHGHARIASRPKLTIYGPKRGPLGGSF